MGSGVQEIIMKKFSLLFALLLIILIIIFLFASCQAAKPAEDLSGIEEIEKIAEVAEIITAADNSKPAESTVVYAETETESDIKIVEIAELVEITEAETEEFIKTLTLPVKTLIIPVTPATPVKKFPVLMYHTSSEDDPKGIADLYVKPSEFEKQIKYLTENNYTLCTFDDWNNLHNIDKPAFITFDDGYEENYTEIFPILKKYNAKITIFLVVNPDITRLTEDMIREMSDSGLVKFESHTLTHADLINISSNEKMLTDELKNSKLKIEEITGKPVVAISYPQGRFNNKVMEKAKEYYNFGVSTEYGRHRMDMDNFKIYRIGIGRNDSLNAFIRFLG